MNFSADFFFCSSAQLDDNFSDFTSFLPATPAAPAAPTRGAPGGGLCRVPFFAASAATTAGLGSSGFFAYIGIRSYKRNITSFSLPFENKKIKIAQIILFPICLFLGLRGGSQAIPINEKDIHYSNVKINNDIATNNIWYLGNSICNRNYTNIKNNHLDAQ